MRIRHSGRALAASALLLLSACGGLIAPDSEADAGAIKDAAGSDSSAIDPCASVACNSPPADHCTDQATARIYLQSGTCSFGNCGYSYTDYDCTYGCVIGECELPDSAAP